MPERKSLYDSPRIFLNSMAVVFSGYTSVFMPAIAAKSAETGLLAFFDPSIKIIIPNERSELLPEAQHPTIEERDQLRKWGDEAKSALEREDWAGAEVIWRKYLYLEEEKLGKDVIEYPQALGYVGDTLRRRRRYAEAEVLYKQALDNFEKQLGPDHPTVATSLNSLALCLDGQRHYTEARSLYERALDIRKKALRSDHPDLATSLYNLALNRVDEKRYAEADTLFAQALNIREKIFGLDHLSTASIRESMALNLVVQRRYAEAEPLFMHILSFREKLWGPKHLQTAESLKYLADNYSHQGNFSASEPLYERVLAIIEKTRGPDNPDTALSLNNLAKNRVDQGRFAEADPLYERALAIREKVLGPNHIDTSSSLNELAVNRTYQRRFAEAEPLYKRSLTILEKTLGPDHPETALRLNNLAVNLSSQGRNAEAEPLQVRALAIREKVLGPDHPLTAASLNNVASVLADQGRYAEAEPLYERSLAIREKVLGPGHPDTAASLGNLAVIRADLGHFAEIEPLITRTIAIREKTLGPDHPYTAASLQDLAVYLQRQGRNVEALPAARRAAAIWSRRISRDSQGGSEQKAGAGAFLTLANLLSHLDPTPDLSMQAIVAEEFQALQYAGSADVARAVSGTLARAAAGSDDLARLVRTRQDLALKARTLLADLDNAIAKPAEQRDADADTALRAEIARTQSELDAATATLAHDFPRFAEMSNPRPASLADVQAALRPDEALVSWTATPIATYLFVVHQGGVSFQRLGLSAGNLRARVAALRDGLDPKGRLPIDMPPFDLAAAHALYRDLLGPAEDRIADARHLILVLDGPLESLPPAVLVTAPPPETGDEAERYRQAAWLVRRQAVSVTPAISSFVALRRFPKDDPAGSTQVADLAGAFAGYGDPDFQGAGPEVEQTPAPSVAQASAEASVALASLFRGGAASPEGLHALPRLPDSAIELRAIAHALDAPNASVHLGREASVSAITGADLSKVKVLAFATHGLIAGELPKLAEPALAFTPPAEPSAEDDGLLRASQVAGLKLGAQFVVLSACNTAAADGTPGASGLSGLAKAFFYAGARSLLVSHWPVDSGAATRLTTATFATLRAEPGIGRAEALRRASLALIDGGRPGSLDANPMIWAPFTLVGEDGAEPASLTTSHADATQPTQK